MTINGAAVDGGVLFALAKDGSGYVILHGFTGGTNDGLSPWGGVIQGQDGLLYGAARHGGAQDAGVVFGIKPDGTGFTIVRSFTTNANEGAFPLNSVIQGSDGRLYGRTISGGTNNGHSIFGLNTNGSGYALLYSFPTNLPDYWDSYSDLVEGSDGLLYGTTYGEGAFGAGSVFRLHKDGSGFQTLHDFAGTATDGGYPYGSVYETREEVLYGATSYGGPDNYGELYKINRDGTGYTVLRFFVHTNTEGYLPVGAPVEGPGDLLYGTTYYGGLNDFGTVYSVRKDGSAFTWLYDFKYPAPNAGQPNARLTWGSDGALYGTTFVGAGGLQGSVFRVKPLVLIARQLAGQVTLRFEGFASQRYSLEAGDSLSPAWSAIANVTNLTGVVEWPVPPPVPTRRFFRAQILNP
jgi:uncharacterized repeat protein (TIGR03803 family)